MLSSRRPTTNRKFPLQQNSITEVGDDEHPWPELPHQRLPVSLPAPGPSGRPASMPPPEPNAPAVSPPASPPTPGPSAHL